jgi:hypothetical protein
VRLEVTVRFLPLYLRGRELQVTKAVLALKTTSGQPVDAFTLALDGTPYDGFPSPATRLQYELGLGEAGGAAVLALDQLACTTLSTAGSPR